MGLAKKYVGLNGENIEYWTIGYMRIDRKKRFVDCRMYGYATEADSKKNYSPSFVRSVRLIEDEYDEVFNNPLVAKDADPFALMYQYAKQKDGFFKDSKDQI
jgi:hypothetical protein